MGHKAKIALVVPSLTDGGGVPAVARFLKDTALRSSQYEIQPISLCMSSNDANSPRLLHPGTWIIGITPRTGEWEGLQFSHVGANLCEFEFQRYRRRPQLDHLLQDCDLIQVVCGCPAWANAVLGLGKPVSLQVATLAKVERRLREAEARGFINWWRKKMTLITSRFDDRALRNVDAIQVENSWMLEHARHVNTGRNVDICYAPPGVDTEIFKPKRFRNLSERQYILCVGRLADPRKNIDLLLSAYTMLPRDLQMNVQLMLAGSSAPARTFCKRVQDLGLSEKVIYIPSPSKEELVQLYQNASVFALPSDEEGLSIVTLESMACAVPVVSTLSGGPDGIITDGQDGYLVPLNDSAMLAERIQLLLKNPQKNIEMGLAARRTIETLFEERASGHKFMEIWDRLLET